MSDQKNTGAGTVAEAPVKEKKGSPSKAARDAVMYVGPNRAYDLPLMKNQVFAGGGAPDFCAALVGAKSHFAACFVSVSALGGALQSLRDAQSDLSRQVAKVAKETAELRKNGAAVKTTGGK